MIDLNNKLCDLKKNKFRLVYEKDTARKLFDGDMFIIKATSDILEMTIEAVEK